ncbi:MAG: hypothetical protein SFV20_01560 [Sphingopyxis sp.]|nr:hypothetical protein [Sphingopyxis sp.]
MDTPEIHAPHSHGASHAGGHWIDKVVAFAALITSVVSIIVAVRHGDTMEKLVEAQSWPYVGLNSSNLVDNQRNISLTLESAGSGPARVRSLAIRYQGKPVTDWPSLIRACCASSATADIPALLRETDGAVVTGGPVGSVLLPGDKAIILSMPLTAANAALWKRLDQRRGRLQLQGCYCSVFDECYVTDFRRAGPRHVDKCPDLRDQWES